MSAYRYKSANKIFIFHLAKYEFDELSLNIKIYRVPGIVSAIKFITIYNKILSTFVFS